jgi:microbial collagenase
MDDYVSRAYRWGYMAMRFMFERRPEVLDTILPMFRRGDYAAYWTYIQRLPPVIDKEFAAWVSAVAMDVEPAQRRHAD